jgi:uracil-DNA glycosylase
MKKLEIDINNLRERINNALEESGWTPALAPFINGLSFDIILNSLVTMYKNGKRFTPKFKDIFNAFKECPYKEIKVIVIGQDPYPQLGSADGIAFSCSKKGKAEKSLQYILKALNDEQGDVDLRRWSNQGVLLLNTAFTCEINSIGSHINLWKPFAIYLFELLNRHHKNVPVIMMGKKAEDWQVYLSNQKLYKVSHPASAAYRGGQWDCKDVFNQVNIELEKQGKACINW